MQLDVLERAADESRLIADRLHAHTGRQGAANHVQPLQHVIDNVHRVRAGLFLDQQRDRRLAVQPGGAPDLLHRVDDAPDIAERDDGTPARRDDDPVEVVDVLDSAHRPDADFRGAGHEAPAGNFHVLALDSLPHLVHGQPVGVQPIGIQQQVDFAMAIADERDGADVLHGLEHLRDLLVGNLGELFGRARARHHQRKNRCRIGVDLLDDGRQRVAREQAHRGGDLVPDILRRAFDVPLQHERDRDASGALVRAGAQLVDAVDRVDGLLERLGDLRFDFLGARARQRHRDAHDGRIGLRHQIQPELAIGKQARDDDGRREHDREHRTIDADAGNDHGYLRPLPRAGALLAASPFESTTGTPAARRFRLVVARRSSPLRPSRISTSAF